MCCEALGWRHHGAEAGEKRQGRQQKRVDAVGQGPLELADDAAVWEAAERRCGGGARPLSVTGPDQRAVTGQKVLAFRLPVISGG